MTQARRFLPLLLSLCLVACESNKPAPEGGEEPVKAEADSGRGSWVELGVRRVDFKAERDTFAVGAEAGTFKKLRFAVKQRGIRILGVKVHYASGQVQALKVRAKLAKGGRTRVIDLAGKRPRRIKKVVFVYRSRARSAGKNLNSSKKGRAHVILWGRH